MSEGNGNGTVSEPSQHAGSRLSNGQFAPGHSGNPGGRPRAVFTHAGLALLRSKEDTDEGGMVKARELMEKLRSLAMNGDVQAARLFMETIQGKPSQELEHSGAVTSVTLHGVDL